MATKIPRRYLSSYLIFIFVMLFIHFGILEIQKAINRSREEKFSDESQINDLVYADIVSMTPESATRDASKRTTSTNEGYFCSCDERNLRNMRLFYSTFPNWNAVRSELTWTHYRSLLKVNDKDD